MFSCSSGETFGGEIEDKINLYRTTNPELKKVEDKIIESTKIDSEGLDNLIKEKFQ